MDEDEIEILEGNFVEGEGEILRVKKGKEPKKTQTILKFNQQKNISEGILFEEGQLFYAQFSDGKEIPNTRKIKNEGARINIVGNKSVGKTFFLNKILLEKTLIRSSFHHKKDLDNHLEDLPFSVPLKITKWRDNQQKIFHFWDFSGLF